MTSTSLGSHALLEQMAAIPQLSYSVSKAAVNNITRRIYFEDKDITAVPFHPGTQQPLHHSPARGRLDSSPASRMPLFACIAVSC